MAAVIPSRVASALEGPRVSEGYYETILDWLRTQVLDADER